jgi:hypothetical protein
VINSAWGRLKKALKEGLTFQLDHEASVGSCQAENRVERISAKGEKNPKLGGRSFGIQLEPFGFSKQHQVGSTSLLGHVLFSVF